MSKFLKDKNLYGKYSVMILLAMLDLLSVALAEFLALFVRFDFSIGDIPMEYMNPGFHAYPFIALISLVFLYLLNLYDSVWAYASVTELISVIIVAFLSADGAYIVMHVKHTPMPRSFYVLYMFFFMILLTASRFSYRVFRRGNRLYDMSKEEAESRVMLIGAGDAGVVILKELQDSEHVNKKVVCVIDDNPALKGKNIRGVDIVGGRNRIIPMAAKLDVTDIIIAIPSAKRKDVKAIVDICKETDCRVQILPGIYQMVNDEVRVSNLRDVDIEDLLGRDPIKVDLDTIAEYVRDKVVMVT